MNTLSSIQDLSSFIHSIISGENSRLTTEEIREYKILLTRLGDFEERVRGVLPLEENPINTARMLFVEIYRMPVGREEKEALLEKAEAILRQANLIPYIAFPYFDEAELKAIANAVDMAAFEQNGLSNVDTPLSRACKKLHHLVARAQLIQTMPIRRIEEFHKSGRNL